MGDREFLEPEYADSVDLSQDSQFSAASTNLSQDLSQGSADLDSVSASSKNRGTEKKKKKTKRDKSSSTKDREKSGDGSEATDCDNSSAIKTSKKSKSSSKHKSDKSDKSEKKHKKHSSRRPEPEGGNPTQTDTGSALEYERIINSTDPLFSDLELDAGDDSAKVESLRPRRPPRQSRAGPAGGIFIPCTQLGINSNTMIKFAIIGTELQNIFQVSQRVGR